MAEATEFQNLEGEAPLLFKTYVLYLDAIFAFRFDICLNGKSQVPEEFYIGSETEEELLSIPKSQLQLLEADVQHLHEKNLAMAMVIQNGWGQRHHPMKAPIEQVAKLNRDILYMYCASHSMAPCIRHGLGQQPTKDQLYECLIRENLVANTLSPNIERWLSERVIPYEEVTKFLFIVTPDCKLITLKFEDKLVQPDDIKKNYVELLQELHGQVVAADQVRLFLNIKFKKHMDKRIVDLDKMKVPCLHAMHLVPFQISVKALNQPLISIMVMSTTTLRELKEMIQDKVNIPPEHWYLRLHWSQEVTETMSQEVTETMSELNTCIAYYNIQKGDTIRLQFRLRGSALELADVNMEEIIMTEC